MPMKCQPIDIQLTQEQVDYIRTTLTEDNDLATDERQLLNGLLEMAERHPRVDPAWRYMKPQ
jgi:hypothetical protein